MTIDPLTLVVDLSMQVPWWMTLVFVAVILIFDGAILWLVAWLGRRRW